MGNETKVDICKLSQDLCDAINDYNSLKKALMIESNIYVKMVALESRIEQLRSDVYNYHHPVNEVK